MPLRLSAANSKTLLLCSDVTRGALFAAIISVNCFNNAKIRSAEVQRCAIAENCRKEDQSAANERASERGCFRNLGLVGREKSERIPARRIIYASDERAKTYPCPKVPGAYYEFTNRPLEGSIGNLSGLFVVALHLRAPGPMQNPVPPYISPGLGGHAAGPDSPQSPLLPVYCIA